MFKWCVRVGYLLCLYSILVYSIDFLPVNILDVISNLFTKKESNIYFKVVGIEGGETYALAAFIIGIALILIGKVYTAKTNT